MAIATPISLALSWPRSLVATELGSGDRHRSFHYGVVEKNTVYKAFFFEKRGVVI